MKELTVQFTVRYESNKKRELKKMFEQVKLHVPDVGGFRHTNDLDLVWNQNQKP